MSEAIEVAQQKNAPVDAPYDQGKLKSRQVYL